jgi:anti-anti-sigma factor
VFDVHVHHLDGTDVVAPVGELDLGTAPRLAAALAASGEHGVPRVVLDLRRLTFVDSSGIGLVVKFKRHFAVEGVLFGVVRGDDIVQRAFALSHVEALLPWTEPPATRSS